MIIDARLATDVKQGRPFTFSAAVSNVLDEIQVGSHVDVTALIDQTGKNLDRLRLDVAVSKIKGDRRFMIRALSGDNMARITRLE